jgi:hypothetical protein
MVRWIVIILATAAAMHLLCSWFPFLSHSILFYIVALGMLYAFGKATD